LPASSSIVVNAQPATPAAPTAGTVTANMCNSNRQFQITGYSASNNLYFTPSVVSISGTGLVTAQVRIPLHKRMQQDVLRQRHRQVLLLMHNPLPPAAPTAGSYTANMCNSNR
jgi:hypothetical protein